MGVLDEGTHLEALKGLREVLAIRLADTGTPATAIPGLSKQLRDVLAELDRLAPAKGSPVDELAKRRRDRQADVQADAAGDK